MTSTRDILRAPHAIAGGPAGALRAFVADVERTCLDGLFVGDHVSFRDGTGYDRLLQSTALATASDRLSIWTAVYLLALRHPVPVARQVASLAMLAPGRFVFGVGLGGDDRHEPEVCGVDPRQRGRRLDACLDVVRALLDGDEVTTDDHDLTIPGALIRPTPRERVPILVGGRSDAAMRRVGRVADGWIAVWVGHDRARIALASIAAAADEHGRAAAPSRHALMVWCGLGGDVGAARTAVGGVMEGLYKQPFADFARYVPIGAPAAVAEVIAPYIELGFEDILLNAVAERPEELLELAADVARCVRRTTTPHATTHDLESRP